MKALVTGANGFLGSWVTRFLVAEGVDVHILHRKNADLSELSGQKFVPHLGDVTDEDSVTAAARGCDVVFHLAGVIGYNSQMRELMENVNVKGTQNVISACVKTKVERLVHLSSVTAIGAGFSAREILNEDSRFNLHHLNLGYFETKLAGEQLVKNAVAKGDLDAVILNPSTIYGAGDARKGSRKTQLKVARGEFPFYTGGGVSIADVESVAAAILQAWKAGKSGERYILGGENISIQETFKLIAEFAGVKPPRLYMPNWAILGLGHLGEAMGSIGLKGPLSLENAWTAILYHWFDSTKAVQQLNYKIPGARESIKKSVVWMRENHLLEK